MNIFRVRWFSVGVILTLAGIACRLGEAAGPTATPFPAVAVEELQFADAETGRRFVALDACARALAGPDWVHEAYRPIGNFYQASWCSQANSQEECFLRDVAAGGREIQVVELSTLFYPGQFPQVFGLNLWARWAPAGQGWGAAFSFAEGGQGVMGSGFSLYFTEYPDGMAPRFPASGSEVTAVGLGDRYTYQVHESLVEHASGRPLREELAAYLASPEAMRNQGLANLAALQQKVEETILAHQVTTCEYGPYEGDGIPPACTLRPLTADEEAAALAEAEQHFNGQQRLLSDDYQEMYAALLKAFPLDRCWEG
ncbi:MAG: hypothetical protein L0332_01810 [Chloroflexi bacterium]|nr:hypothetical protein [Chloroflexota bacterium]MCI0579794.1 hypothetical protein [Chloroflexota bacterium]MCI0648606.1 hypothetical protein [Chloroflexota bacterium]MCI0725449.1 hypothetical protein [Chloroflexota bacterium]